MVVRVDEAGQHERTVEIDDDVAVARRRIDRKNGGGEPKARRVVSPGRTTRAFTKETGRAHPIISAA